MNRVASELEELAQQYDAESSARESSINVNTEIESTVTRLSPRDSTDSLGVEQPLPGEEGRGLDAEPVGEQGALFSDPLLDAGLDGLPDQLIGFRGPTVCQVVGITYRQLDYWASTGLVVASIRGAAGSSSQRLYSFKDVLVLKIVKRLLDAGVSLENIRAAVEHLRRRGIRDLAGVTLFSDGATVYETSSPEEVVDLLRGGQGVFGIDVSGVIREISGSIKDFPAERGGSNSVENSASSDVEQSPGLRLLGGGPGPA